MKKISVLFLVFISLSAPLQAFSISNFRTPESFIVDPEDGSYYVSNIAGDPVKKDGNGFISKIAKNGKSVIQHFIGSNANSALDAPKGLLIVGEDLYVTDIDTIKVFNKKTGKMKKRVDFSPYEANFLNDLAADEQGLIYASDMLKDRIFVMNPAKDYETGIYMESPRLGNPNGLRFNSKTKNLIVVTFGSGEVLEIDRYKNIHVLKHGFQALDGIDFDNANNLYISSFKGGTIYKITNFGRGIMTTVASSLVTPADISLNREKNEILVPSFQDDKVFTIPLLKPSDRS